MFGGWGSVNFSNIFLKRKYDLRFKSASLLYRLDPRARVSGVESFILSERVAPIQQSFYFTNPSVSKDGKVAVDLCRLPALTPQISGILLAGPGPT